MLSESWKGAVFRKWLCGHQGEIHRRIRGTSNARLSAGVMMERGRDQMMAMRYEIHYSFRHCSPSKGSSFLRPALHKSSPGPSMNTSPAQPYPDFVRILRPSRNSFNKLVYQMAIRSMSALTLNERIKSSTKPASVLLLQRVLKGIPTRYKVSTPVYTTQQEYSASLRQLSVLEKEEREVSTE